MEKIPPDSLKESKSNQTEGSLTLIRYMLITFIQAFLT